MSFTNVDVFVRDAKKVLGYDRVLVDGDAGVRRVMFDLASGETGASGVMGDTRVDTGRARSSWMISEDAPDYSTVPDTDGRKMSAGEISAANGRQLSGMRPNPRMPARWLTNALDYIHILEYGGKGRRPWAMLRRNLARVKAKYGA